MFAGKRNEKEPKLVVIVVGGYVDQYKIHL